MNIEKNKTKDEEEEQQQQTTTSNGGAGLDDLNAEDIETNWDEVNDSFDHMGLKDDLLRGIYAYG